MRESNQEFNIGLMRQDAIEKRKKKVVKLETQIDGLESKQDEGDELIIANKKEIGEADDLIKSIELQIKYAQEIAADKSICFLIDMTIDQVRDYFGIRNSEDIDAILDDESYDLLNDFVIGGMLLNGQYSYEGPDEIETAKKVGYTLNDRKAIIAKILQIDWKPKGEAEVAVAPKGEAEVAVASAKRARDEDSDDDSDYDDEYNHLMSHSPPQKKLKSENH